VSDMSQGKEQHMNHKAKYEIYLYEDSDMAYEITFRCTCGVRQSLTDGIVGPTMNRARAAFKSHVEKAKVTS